MNDIASSVRVLDVVVIALYFAVVVVIGVTVARRTRTGEDLFLAGRSLGWLAIGVSLFASNISTTTIIGLSGSAYADGIAVSAYEWLAGLPLIVLAFVFAPLFLRARITTIPEYLELRYDRIVRRYFSATTIALTVLIDTAGGLYAGGMVLRTFFPEVPLWWACVGIGVFAGLYTAAGGLRAVVYTDILQAVVLITGSAAVSLVMFQKLGFTWDEVLAATPADHFSIVQPVGDSQLPWPGLATGVVILGFWYWVTNQYIVQRVLGAKDLQNAQWGAMLGGALKLLPMFIMVLPGAMAIAVYPDIPNRDMVFPTMITQALPVGLTGLVIAGLVAAIMSSVDSTLNSSSTLIVHDFVTSPDQPPAPRQARRWGTITTLVLMTLAVSWAPAIANFGGLWSYLQQAFSILVPPVAAIFLVGALWPRATARGALAALVVGHAAALGLFVLTQMGVWPLHFTINVAVMTALSALVLVGVSLAGPAPAPATLERAIWRPQLARPPEQRTAPWWADVRLHAVLVAVGMLAILIGFW